MAKEIQWPEYPLIGNTRIIAVADADVTAAARLFPDADPCNPPWKELEKELLQDGYESRDLWNIKARRLSNMLAVSRSSRVEWEGPQSPTQWARRFDKSVTTFSRMRKRGQLRSQEVTSKLILIHRDDVLRYEKK